MINRLRMLLLVVCLLLAAASAVLWVRSYIVGDSLEWDRMKTSGVLWEDGRDFVAVGRGAVVIAKERQQLGEVKGMDDLMRMLKGRYGTRQPFEWKRISPVVNPTAKWPSAFGWRFLGFGRIVLKDNDGLKPGETPRPNYQFRAVSVPLWLGVILFGLPPAVWIRGKNRRYRQDRPAEALQPG